MITSPHDRFFRKIFSKKEIARDFIENYLPAELNKIIDTQNMKILKDSFIDKKLKDSFSDMAYSVDINDIPGYLYLLFEHKSFPDKLVAFQLLKYLTRIWELHLNQNKTDKLPVIIPLVIYHGRKKYNVNIKFSALLNKQAEVEKYIPDFNYILYDFSQFNDTEIMGSIQSRLFLQILHNIFKDNFEDELEEILLLFRKLENTETVLEYFEIAVRYIINVREISMNNLQNKVNKTIPERSENLMTLGEKLRKEGELENLRETIAVQLPKKLNIDKLPDTLHKDINSADIDKLKKIRDNIFEINSLDEVKKYLN